MTGKPLKYRSLCTFRLRTTLVAPFVAQIIAAVGIVGYVSFWNGQPAIQRLASKLVREISNQVAQYLDVYTSLPHQINQINLDAVELGILDLGDFEEVGQHFWRQLEVFDVGYINYGSIREGFIGAERLDNGTFLIQETPPTDINHFYSYTTDATGNRLTQIDVSTSAQLKNKCKTLCRPRSGRHRVLRFLYLIVTTYLSIAYSN